MPSFKKGFCWLTQNYNDSKLRLEYSKEGFYNNWERVLKTSLFLLHRPFPTGSQIFHRAAFFIKIRFLFICMYVCHNGSRETHRVTASSRAAMSNAHFLHPKEFHILAKTLCRIADDLVCVSRITLAKNHKEFGQETRSTEASIESSLISRGSFLQFVYLAKFSCVPS